MKPNTDVKTIGGDASDVAPRVTGMIVVGAVMVLALIFWLPTDQPWTTAIFLVIGLTILGLLFGGSARWTWPLMLIFRPLYRSIKWLFESV